MKGGRLFVWHVCYAMCIGIPSSFLYCPHRAFYGVLFGADRGAHHRQPAPFGGSNDST